MSEKGKTLSCSDCKVLNCFRKAAKFPAFCLTEKTDAKQLKRIVEKVYQGKGIDAKIARAAAEIEGKYYGRLTRVEETIAFARRIGAVKIGVASCIGLIEESRLFCEILKINDLEPFTVICKVGAVDKSEIGIPDDLKVQKGCHESLCNPALQAELMNEQKTDLNVIVGLCVGHDSIFIRHSKAPVTTLIVKDRVLGHNPAAALYTSGFYYKKLFQKGRDF